ncbi:heavy metal translocating P-type ATPase [Bowmanella pacifica]|uniref:P-type Cu(2+) transporter n=1 Tax=Bowmanella pacifica TaxID=502051 RepID=A0A918DJ70_9ALTE|nr:heavy metal translocating P-type ATPase [Bowmanella pacifica]GGO69664.1 copper-translocating P-type ATPase [Bowmanella pacifica]
MICFHCHQEVTEQGRYHAKVLGESQPMCCPGCQAVAEAIVANGLEDYYKFRTEPAERADGMPNDLLEKLKLFDQPELQEEFVVNKGKDNQVQLSLEGISCAACAWLIEKKLAKLPGIKQIAVNVSARRALVSWYPEQLALSGILAAIENIGYHAQPFHPKQQEEQFKKTEQSYLKRIGLSGLMTMQVMMIAVALYFGLFGNLDEDIRQFMHWVSLTLSVPVVLYSGAIFYQGAWRALRSGSVNMDVPISVAIWALFIASAKATIIAQGEVFFESVCMFIFLLLISRFLEHKSRHKAAQISANMSKYIPVTATLLENGQASDILAKLLKVDQLVLVKAGETIPVDGVVIDGTSHVDESMLTGEFEPVNKKAGDEVFGGALNQSGSLTIKVLRPLKEAMVSQILRLQDEALLNKPAIAQLADRISSYFVLAVLAISALTFWYWHAQGNVDAFWITASVLVATCPCALGLATPSALTCAMARLNRQGILLKRADLLESLTSINMLAFDKTGTLTEGKFSIQRTVNLSSLPEQQILEIAAALEMHSEHPLAKAFNHYQVEPATHVEIIAGLGLCGEVKGIHYQLGSSHLIKHGIPAALTDCNVLLADAEQVLAGFVLTDQVRSDALSMLEDLKGYERCIISGDSQHNVEKIAEQLQITKLYSQCRPEQKLQTVQTLQQQGHQVLMVGDGINDTPVLAAAQVSVAVGGASDLAKNAADIILINPTLTLLPELFKMAQRTKQKIMQNMAWALGYNVLVLPLAVSGYLTPWLGVIGMSLSSIIVVANSVRLLKADA